MDKYKLYYSENSENSKNILKKIIDFNLRDKFHLIRLDNYLKKHKTIPKCISTVPSVIFSDDSGMYEVRNNDIHLLLDDLSKNSMKQTLKSVKDNKNSWLESVQNVKPGTIKPEDLKDSSETSTKYSEKTSKEDVDAKMEELKRKREQMDERLKNIHRNGPMSPDELNRLFDKK